MKKHTFVTRFAGGKSKEANKNPNKKAGAILASAFLFAGMFSSGCTKSVSPQPEEEILDVGTIDMEFLRERLSLMRDWFLANQRSDGFFPYFYNPQTQESSIKGNLIRQLLATQGIFALAEELDDSALRQAGEKHLEAFLKEYLVEEDSFGYLERKGEVKLGASALAIIAILEGGQEAKYEQKIQLLGEFVKAMQQANGSFQTFYKPEDFSTNQRFYSGEALLAFVKLYEKTQDIDYLARIKKSLEYYQPLLEENFYPQFVPWHTMAYAQTWEAAQDEAYANFIFMMNDKLIREMQETEDSLTRGRFYNQVREADWGVPHSSSTAIYLEGITYAYEIAKAVGDTVRVENYRKAILLATRDLLQLQWTPANTADPKLIGAIAREAVAKNFRIDQIGHAANALTRVWRILKGEI